MLNFPSSNMEREREQSNNGHSITQVTGSVETATTSQDGGNTGSRGKAVGSIEEED